MHTRESGQLLKKWSLFHPLRYRWAFTINWWCMPSLPSVNDNYFHRSIPHLVYTAPGMYRLICWMDKHLHIAHLIKQVIFANFSTKVFFVNWFTRWPPQPTIVKHWIICYSSYLTVANFCNGVYSFILSHCIHFNIKISYVRIV